MVYRLRWEDAERTIADLHECLAAVVKEANRGLANGDPWLATHAGFVLENVRDLASGKGSS